MSSDDGVSPVVAVALLIGLVAVAGAIIGLTMFAALEDAAGTPPDVRFQVSADGKSLYHAGGDALPLKNLIFYDTSVTDKELANITGSLTKKSGDKGIWRTGELLTFAEDNVLKTLSIVGLDSRNRPAVLWMGADAVVLPVGDMVPDEWTWIPTTMQTPFKPVVIPTPIPTGEEGIFHNNQDVFLFGDVPLIESTGQGQSAKLISTLSYPQPSQETKVVFDMHNNDYKLTKFNVTVYNSDGTKIFTTPWKEVKHKMSGSIEIEADNLKTGYICHVTVEVYKEENKRSYCRTTVITIT